MTNFVVIDMLINSDNEAAKTFKTKNGFDRYIYVEGFKTIK